MMINSTSRLSFILFLLYCCAPIAAFRPFVSCYSDIHRRPLSAKRTDSDNRNGDNTNCNCNDQSAESWTRRRFVRSAALVAAASRTAFPWLVLTTPAASQARGLVTFPVNDPTKLLNTYHFMRVGETLLDQQDIWSTNPLFLTNREAALTPLGIEQVQAACAQMAAANRTPTVVKYSLAAGAMDTANVVSDQLDLGKDRLVPEFTFLDPRGIGGWEMLKYSQTAPAVWALDVSEAGAAGTGGRPPPNQDGTAHETLADAAVRLRQAMSVLETLYSGETILVVFPDGTGPALLSCMFAGIPFNRVHELEFVSGEVRLDVTKSRALEVWKEKQQSREFEEYKQALEKGKTELLKLRSTSADDIVNVKDQRLEEERVEIEKQQQERESKRLQKEIKEKEDRVERQRLSEVERQGRRLQKQKGVETGAGIPLEAVGAAVVVAAGGLFAVSGIGNTESTSEPLDNATINATADKVQVRDPGAVMRKDGVVAQDQTVTATEDLDASAALPEQPQDPFRAAEEAMQDYLNKDDGAEDFLASMSQILKEEEKIDNKDGDLQQ